MPRSLVDRRGWVLPCGHAAAACAKGEETSYERIPQFRRSVARTDDDRRCPGGGWQRRRKCDRRRGKVAQTTKEQAREVIVEAVWQAWARANTGGLNSIPVSRTPSG